MSMFESIKKFFKKLFMRNNVKKFNLVNDNLEKNEIKKNEHDEYIDKLRSEYQESSLKNNKDYKKLKFIDEIYVEPNPEDGTGLNKK